MDDRVIPGVSLLAGTPTPMTVGAVIAHQVTHRLVNTPNPLKWLSDTTCDECHKDCRTQGEWFVDGKTMYGPWGLLCQRCTPRVYVYGPTTFGTGLGQQYSSATLEKVAG